MPACLPALLLPSLHCLLPRPIKLCPSKTAGRKKEEESSGTMPKSWTSVVVVSLISDDLILGVLAKVSAPVDRSTCAAGCVDLIWTLFRLIVLWTKFLVARGLVLFLLFPSHQHRSTDRRAYVNARPLIIAGNWVSLTEHTTHFKYYGLSIEILLFFSKDLRTLLWRAPCLTACIAHVLTHVVCSRN
jgi:hypothetical protein